MSALIFVWSQKCQRISWWLYITEPDLYMRSHDQLTFFFLITKKKKLPPIRINWGNLFQNILYQQTMPYGNNLQTNRFPPPWFQLWATFFPIRALPHQPVGFIPWDSSITFLWKIEVFFYNIPKGYFYNSKNILLPHQRSARRHPMDRDRHRGLLCKLRIPTASGDRHQLQIHHMETLGACQDESILLALSA